MVAQAQMIDNFSDGELSLSVTNLEGETVTQDGLTASSVVEGTREIYAGTLERGSLSIDTDEQSLTFDAVESFGYFELRYGNSTALEIDLIQSGASAIQLDFASVTPGLRRGLYDVILESPNARATQSFSQELFALPGSGQIVLPLSDFRVNFGDINFSNISTITVSVGRVEPGFQLSLNSIESIPIPEPSPLLGDVNLDGSVNFQDISPFIATLFSGVFLAEADCDESGAVDFKDISAFISILIGS